MGIIINTEQIAQDHQQELMQQVSKLQKRNIIPTLATILVGNDPASTIYVSNKLKKAASLNIQTKMYTLAEDTEESKLLELIDELNQNSTINGILVQLPLPSHINSKNILQRLDPNKDVDGLHPLNAAKLLHNDPTGFVPCTPLACQYILAKEVGDLTGKNICIIGRSQLVGLPLFHLLLHKNATLTVAHSKTLNLPEICKRADIIVSAVGNSKFINENYVSNNQVLIDVGISRIVIGSKKYITGDIDTHAVLAHVKAITPVPKGVGILTIMFLMYNVLKATAQQNNLPFDS
ncbi:Bifunctional protein FolD protein [Candidatus Hepatincola sp. Pdp]